MCVEGPFLQIWSHLAKGLLDICTEAKYLEALTVGEKVHGIQFFWMVI